MKAMIKAQFSGRLNRTKVMMIVTVSFVNVKRRCFKRYRTTGLASRAPCFVALMVVMRSAMFSKMKEMMHMIRVSDLFSIAASINQVD
ncbi:MAG: hypothetical protein N2317_00330 [Syntrophales bacterium]|nr:hypothetical protein [Syntrophales bacterium]